MPKSQFCMCDHNKSIHKERVGCISCHSPCNHPHWGERLESMKWRELIFGLTMSTLVILGGFFYMEHLPQAHAGGTGSQVMDRAWVFDVGEEVCLDGGVTTSGWLVQNWSEDAAVVCTFDGVSTPRENGEECGFLPGVWVDEEGVKQGETACEPAPGIHIGMGEHINIAGHQVTPCCIGVGSGKVRLHTVESRLGPGGPTPGFGFNTPPSDVK